MSWMQANGVIPMSAPKASASFPIVPDNDEGEKMLRFFFFCVLAEQRAKVRLRIIREISWSNSNPCWKWSLQMPSSRFFWLKLGVAFDLTLVFAQGICAIWRNSIL
jgi:hypothetical protein